MLKTNLVESYSKYISSDINVLVKDFNDDENTIIRLNKKELFLFEHDHYELFLPMLYPLSALDTELVFNDLFETVKETMINRISYLLPIRFNLGVSDVKNIYNILKTCQMDNNNAKLPFFVKDILVEHGFDVNNLIEKGYALNKIKI